jgi:NitT/TauT family transport system substrate-binding protein
MLRATRHALLPLLLIMSMMAFVACSDDDDDADPTAGATTAATAASASTPAASTTKPATSGTTVRIGFSAWPGWFPWQVADEAGIFDEVGVDVDLTYFEGYLDSINALAADQLDANAQTLNDTIGSVAAGSDQVIVLVNDNSTGNDQIIVTEEIKTVADLKGKKIAVEPGVVDQFLLQLGLQANGLTAADVDITPLETGAAAAAFAAGQLDGVGVFAPFTTQAMTRAGAHVLFSSKDYPGAIPDHLTFSRKFVDEHPDDVQKVVDAWFKTLDYIKANPGKAIDIMSKRAGVTAEEYKGYAEGTTIFTLPQNVEAFGPGTTYKSLQYAATQIAQFMLDFELIEKIPDLTKLFEPKFVQKLSTTP